MALKVKIKSKAPEKSEVKTTQTSGGVSDKPKANPEMKSWKLIGRKPLTLFNGEVIQPEQVFQARGRDIPKGFMNVLQAIPDVVNNNEQDAGGETIETKPNVSKNPAKNGEKPQDTAGDNVADDEGADAEGSGDPDAPDPEAGNNANPKGKYTYEHEKSGWYKILSPDGSEYSADKYREGQAKKIVDELNFVE